MARNKGKKFQSTLIMLGVQALSAVMLFALVTSQSENEANANDTCCTIVLDEPGCTYSSECGSEPNSEVSEPVSEFCSDPSEPPSETGSEFCSDPSEPPSETGSEFCSESSEPPSEPESEFCSGGTGFIPPATWEEWEKYNRCTELVSHWIWKGYPREDAELSAITTDPDCLDYFKHLARTSLSSQP